MTKKQQVAMDIVHGAFVEGRSSVTASFVASRAGEPFETRKWSSVLTSLDRAGHIRAIVDPFIQRTFYVLPDQRDPA